MNNDPQRPNCPGKLGSELSLIIGLVATNAVHYDEALHGEDQRNRPIPWSRVGWQRASDGIDDRVDDGDHNGRDDPTINDARQHK